MEVTGVWTEKNIRRRQVWVSRRGSKRFGGLLAEVLADFFRGVDSVSILSSTIVLLPRGKIRIPEKKGEVTPTVLASSGLVMKPFSESTPVYEYGGRLLVLVGVHHFLEHPHINTKGLTKTDSVFFLFFASPLFVRVVKFNRKGQP